MAHRTNASHHTFRTAAGILAAASILLLSSAATVAASQAGPDQNCEGSSFTYSVPAGENPAFMTTVTVTVKELAEGCSQAFSLNAYSAEGPTWPTSGTQALIDHDSITLDDNTRSGTLSVKTPECFGQTDFYKGSERFDGDDGALPSYPGTVTPTHLISWSNGGHECTAPSEDPSTAPSEAPSTAPSEAPSTAPSEAPSTEATTAPSTDPTPSATGKVLAETGGPTLPPTDTIGVSASDGSGTSNPALPFALLGMAAMMAAVISYTRFATKRNR